MVSDRRKVYDQLITEKVFDVKSFLNGTMLRINSRSGLGARLSDVNHMSLVAFLLKIGERLRPVERSTHYASTAFRLTD